MKKKQKLGRKLLSFLLTLAMIVGLMPEMGLTAKAADNTTFYPASTYTGFATLASGDETVTISEVSDKDWYVIGYDSTADTVTLLSKQSFDNQAFNADNSKGNSYAESDINTYVEGLTGEGKALAEIKEVLASVSVTNPDVTGKVPYLLSIAEANGLSSETKKYGVGSNWWLRSPGENANDRASYWSGDEKRSYTNGFVAEKYGVRIALQLDLLKVDFDSNTNTFSPIIEYPLWVGGKQVTSANMNDVFGDGKVSYTPAEEEEPAVLTLNGYSYEGAGCDSTGSGSAGAITTSENLNIVINGTNSVKCTDTNGIYSKGNLTISGTGSLTSEGDSYGICSDDGSVTVSSGIVTAIGSTKAIRGSLKNAIAGTGWTNTEGTQGKTDIAVSEEGQDISSYKKVQFPAEPWLYNITIPTTEHGTVTAKVGDEKVTEETKVEAGKTVTLNVTPASGYKLDNLDIKYEGIIDSEDTVSEIKKDDILSYAQIKAFVETHEGILNFAQFNIDENYNNAKYQKKDGVWGFDTYTSNMQEQEMSGYNWKCTGGNIENNAYLFEKAVVLIPITPKQDGDDVNKFTFTMPKGDETVTATFEPGATAPTIKTQPKALELIYGYTEGSVSVEATAAESHTLSYQWYSNTTNTTEGGTAIKDATKASYTIPTGKNANTVEYYYCVVTATFMDTTATTTSDVAKVTVKKADSSVKTAPKARDITYTGLSQALVEGGTANGGVLQYALGTDDKTAPTTGWSENIPSKKDAGTYYVWYKVVGDKNHNDSDPKCVKVEILAQISKTVTFKVVNGSWNDGTTADKTVTLTGYEGDTLKLTADQIPAVGTKPGTGYKAGSWDVTPKADAEIKADITYIYTYAKEEVIQVKTDVDTLAINAGFKVTQSGSKITVKWGKVKSATGYEVYVAYCSKSFSKTPAKRTTTKNSVVVTKIGGKKINLKKNFKVYVKAIKKNGSKNKQLARTITGHIVGRKNTKYTNAKSITLKTKKLSIAVGKTSKIKAKTVLVDKSKKQLSNAHATEFRYASSNKNIATVDKNGKVKGVAKGTCTIYVYARNGYAKTVKVTVK